MKFRTSLPVVLATLAVLCHPVRGQDAGDPAPLDSESVRLETDSPPKAKSDAPAPIRESLNEAVETEAKVIAALPPADQKRLQELLRDASTFVSGIRLQEAFEKLLEAEAIAPDLFTIHNLKGAAYTKMRDFEKARASFTKAIKIAPEAFMARFNLAETEFVTHNYDAAIKGLTPLLAVLEEQAKEAEASAVDPKKPLDPSQRKNLQAQAKATRGTIKLINYKLLICRLKTEDPKGAGEIQKSFNFMDDDPAFYYGNAAIAYHKADQNKGDEKAVRAAQEEAQQWLRSAEKIYDRQQLEIYTDSLIEAGWIDNLQ